MGTEFQFRKVKNSGDEWWWELHHSVDVRVPLNCAVKYGWGSEWVKVTQSCLTLCNPIDYRVHGILQARLLEWVAFPTCRGSSQPRDWTQVSHIAGGFFTSWVIREVQEYWRGQPIPSPADFPRNQTGDFCIAGRFFSIKHYETFTTTTTTKIKKKRICNANCWLKDHRIVLQFQNLDHFPKVLFQSSNLPAKSTISFNLFLLDNYRIR